MTDEEFYAECAALLGADHEGHPFPYRKRTRWNNRIPGRGRFKNAGLIRIFGNQIHVALTKPRIMGIYDSKDVALRAIRGMMENS